MDDSGYIFYNNGIYYRAIYQNEAERFNDMLQSGFLDELTKLNLIPPTKLSNKTIDDKKVAFLLEHESIGPISYPYEWSFNMLKDSAILIIELNEIARKLGYETKDAHWYNVVFHYTTPKFIDIGSFFPISKNQKSWRALRDFKRSYYYPLYLWSKGERYFSMLSLTRGSERIADAYFYSKKYWIINLLPFNIRVKLFKYWYEYRALSYHQLDQLINRSNGIKKALFKLLSYDHLLPFQSVNFKFLRKQINRLRPPKVNSRWGQYHSHYSEEDIRNKVNPRFHRISELVDKYGIKTAVEIGGNQGFFSRYILTHTLINSVICTDYDEPAIDRLY